MHHKKWKPKSVGAAIVFTQVTTWGTAAKNPTQPKRCFSYNTKINCRQYQWKDVFGKL